MAICTRYEMLTVASRRRLVGQHSQEHLLESRQSVLAIGVGCNYKQRRLTTA